MVPGRPWQRRLSTGTAVESPAGAQRSRRRPADAFERVRNARRLAALRSRQPSSSLGQLELEPAFDEDIRFLREALPEFEIRRRLNHGGQGVVYMGVQRDTRRPVAIKLLLDGPFASERQRRRLACEIELASRLEHPNIVRLYQSGVMRGRPYFAMQYIEGMPIDEHVMLGDLTLDRVVRLFLPVCRAVAYAHQQGVLHRDLNPANILVDVDNTPYVCDFGLAKDLWLSDEARGRGLTRTGQVLGTQPYLAPEQVGGDDGVSDVRTDVYALGVLLYWLLAFEFPYPVDTDPQTFRQTLLFQPPHALGRALAIGRGRAPRRLLAELQVILNRALAKAKDQRYASAAELADDLDRALAGEPVQARAPSRLYLLRSTLRRYRVAVGVAAGFVALISASLVVTTGLWLEARRQRDQAMQFGAMTHDTLGHVLHEVDEAIVPLAGGMAARERILAGLADKLAGLSERAAGAEFSALGAPLHERQGDIAHALGRLAEAEAHYARFLELAPSRADQARAERKLALDGASSRASQHFAQAVAIGVELCGQAPAADLRVRRELARARVGFARHLCRIGQVSAAAEQLDAALPVISREAAAGARPEWSALLAEAYEWLAEVRLHEGDASEALAALEQAARLNRGLLERRPVDARRRHALFTALAKQGGLLRDAGRPEEALAVMEESVTVGQELVAADPTITDWKRDLYGAHDRLARLSMDRGELARAELHAEAGMALVASLLEADPDSRAWRDLHGFAHVLAGRLWLAGGNPQRALDYFERSRRIRTELASESEHASRYLLSLANSQHWIGAAYRQLGEAECALAAFGEQQRLCRTLAEDDPQSLPRRLDLVRAEFQLASAYAMLDSPEARQQAQQILTHAAAALQTLQAPGRGDGLEGQESSVASLMQALDHDRGELAAP